MPPIIADTARGVLARAERRKPAARAPSQNPCNHTATQRGEPTAIGYNARRAQRVDAMAELKAALKRIFGFEQFRAGQEAVVRDALSGRDVLALMPTGGGKSLCFQLPALLQPGVTLVVSPLIALMQDQVRLLRDNDIAASFINSGLDASEVSRRTAALLRGEYKLFYLAPERLLLPEFLDEIGRASWRARV